MRDIKFRGKRIDNGEWVYGNLVQSINEGVYILDTPSFFPAKTFPARMFIEVHSESVGQYTGLKDKEGKELYEGDIVQCPGRPWWILKTQKRYLFEVGEPMGANLFYNGDWTILSEHILKIGNVHDNPDLILEILKS